MAKSKNRHFVIGLKETVVEKAEESCRRRGTTLRRIVEDVISQQASIRVKDADAFIQESDAAKEIWCPSRSTLFNMRQSGELVEDTHFVERDGLIFYKFAALRDYMRKHKPDIEKQNRLRTEEITG